MMRVGLLINPLAGIGGAVGLKGSDGEDIAAEALRRGAVPRAADRAAAMFGALADARSNIEWWCPSKSMGGELLDSVGVKHTIVYVTPETTSATQTFDAMAALQNSGVGLLVFAGGDGTARDIASVIGTSIPVIGIPAGVKMHSGVFATSPRSAAAILLGLQQGELVSSVIAEVRDVDEVAARDGRAASRFYGEMRVPAADGFVQHTKIGGREDDGLAVEEIVQGVCALVSDALHRPLVLGPGGTILAIKERLGTKGTLLGVDVRLPDGGWRLDVGETELLALRGSPLVIVGFGRNQGIVFGRGNQQLSAEFLRRLDGRRDIVIVGTRSKLKALGGRPLLLDTGDAALDTRLGGLRDILCGYDDRLLYRVDAG